MRFTITVTGIDKAIKDITAEANTLSSHRLFLRREVVPELRKQFRNVFRTRGFGKWQPLAPSTIAEKRSKGYSIEPLVRTGVYRSASRNLRGLRVRRNQLEVTSPITYAKYHEFGTRGRPQRPVFEFVADKMKDELPRLYRRYTRRRTR